MKTELEREKCIGCGSCAALCEEYFEMAEDGKSNLKGSSKNLKTGNFELETEKAGCIKEAVEACPVQIIHTIK